MGEIVIKENGPMDGTGIVYSDSGMIEFKDPPLIVWLIAQAIYRIGHVIANMRFGGKPVWYWARG